MPRRPRLLAVVGTRPEAVKLAPVALRLRRPGSGLDLHLVDTGQHPGVVAQALGEFGLAADESLDVLVPGQGLPELLGRSLTAIAGVIRSGHYDVSMAVGDTSTVLATALASHYARLPFAHVEAGLRTGRAYEPFPEEAHRVLAAHLAAVHLAPTARARANLLREGIDGSTIHVVGNPVVDALLLVAARPTPLPCRPPTPRFLLATAHRRENWGAPLAAICRGLRLALAADPGLSLVLPTHPNPAVRAVVEAELGGVDRALLPGPIAYPGFVALMKACTLVLTDSGGIQEEAPALGKPVLVLRDATERPEGLDAGCSILVGTDADAIAATIRRLLGDPAEYESRSRAISPYGDGHAAERIERILMEFVGRHEPGPR